MSSYFQSAYLWNSTYLLHVWVVCSVLLLHHIPFCDYTTVGLSKLLDTVEGPLSCFQFGAIMNNAPLNCMCLLVAMYSCVLGICIGVSLLVHRVGTCSALALVNTATKFS